jgi:hypothetical protein
MKGLREAWASPNFDRLRQAHRARTWDDAAAGEPICRSCAVTKLPTRIESRPRALAARG